MKAKTGFGNMAGKGSAKRPYDLKKFDKNYLKPSGKFKSCDNCVAQEGRHYCLLHSKQIKNMDASRCDKWEARSQV